MTGREPRRLAAADLEDLVGCGLGTSEPLQVDLPLVRGFADLTGDQQWIHVDAERAADGPYGGPVAHGYLVLSLIPRLLWQVVAFDETVAEVNYGLDRVRFPAPLRVSDSVRATATLAEVEQRPAGTLVKLDVRMVSDQQERPVCVARPVVLLAR